MITQLYVSGHLGRGENLIPTLEDADWTTKLCATHDVTGLTLYSDGDFLSILEGSFDATLAVMEGVGQDPRINAVKIILREEKPAREFPQYSIGFRSVDYSEQVTQTFRLTADNLSRVLPDQPSVSLRVMTHSFAKVHSMPIVS